MSVVRRLRRGVRRSCSNRTGRKLMYRSSPRRIPSRMSSACLFDGTRGSPKAPARIALYSSDNISRAPSGSVTPSRRNFWGAEKFLREGVTLPDGALEMLSDEYNAILAGAFGDPRVPSNKHAEDILLGMRRGLDL